MSQSSPENPSGHAHVYELSPSVQTPPFWQGLGEQSSTSTIMSRLKGETQLKYIRTLKGLLFTYTKSQSDISSVSKNPFVYIMWCIHVCFIAILILIHFILVKHVITVEFDVVAVGILRKSKERNTHTTLSKLVWKYKVVFTVLILKGKPFNERITLLMWYLYYLFIFMWLRGYQICVGEPSKKYALSCPLITQSEKVYCINLVAIDQINVVHSLNINVSLIYISCNFMVIICDVWGRRK